ncbi:MAG: molybdopterin-dependent oxidoreductase [Acidobacteria bacterium]|nr:molybdopterin-dependent oxidoreductase [Acidobacteriota bacterium]
MPGLGTSFGRGGATTAQQDLANSDAILIMGSSMAENHPVGFQWVMEAKKRGAKVIHVDPRFTRTSAVADYWLPLRAGSDITFLGGLVNHVIEHDRIFRDYVVAYTNAPVLLRDDLRLPDENEGLFSGWNGEEDPTRYDPESWFYRNSRERANREPDSSDRGGEGLDFEGIERDDTLEDPRTVYQKLKAQFSRYTPEMVQRVCGVPRDRFVEIAKIFSAASGPEKTAAICYAVGWTQHSSGVQTIRTAAILQMLLGNIGRPGGGILALRGHASIQGSTDIPTLFDILPGYLAMPKLGESANLDAHLFAHKVDKGWWANYDRYLVSLLKAYYGSAATESNDWGFGWLPRVTGDHSHQGYWLEMARGELEGLFVMGQNPAVGAPSSGFERKALAQLDWMVVRDLVETETASFWRNSPEVRRGETKPEEIETEVFLLPAAGHAEKDGTFTNTQRLLQWHDRAVEPPGDARSETWFMVHLGRLLKARAEEENRKIDEPLRALTWDYRTDSKGEPDAEEVLREINGSRTATGELVSGYGDLEADGSTSCGCWIYSGVFPEEGRNRARERAPTGPYAQGWGWAWPSDRRILYNRASARPDGAPWSESKKLVWWDEVAEKWTGLDTPDFASSKRPDYIPDDGATGDDALRGDRPFIMHQDGAGWIWVPSGLRDGPLPAHYEPLEAPIRNPFYDQQVNPAATRLEPDPTRWAESPDERYPFVLTTYRLTEHHTAGGMTRTLPRLAELQPELFCEISPQLASERAVRNGDEVEIATPRGRIRAKALVTPRMRSLEIDGKVVHQVGLPYHWGSNGVVTGDIVNDLVALSEEPNVKIMESKGLLCDLRPVGSRT